MLTRLRGPLAVLVAVALGSGLLAWHDRDVAKHALLHQRIAADSARADSAEQEAHARAQREAYWRAVADSLHRATARHARALDSLQQRVTILRPGMIRVTSGAPASKAGSGVRGGSPPPAVTVTVPPAVTDLMQAQATRIHDLERALAVADSGWAAADRVIVAQGRQIAALNRQVAALTALKEPRWGVKTGIALGALATVGAVWAAGQLR